MDREKELEMKTAHTADETGRGLATFNSIRNDHSCLLAEMDYLKRTLPRRFKEQTEYVQWLESLSDGKGDGKS